jgi:hypothetical protein
VFLTAFYCLNITPLPSSVVFTANLSSPQVVTIESSYNTLVHGLQERSDVGRQYTTWRKHVNHPGKMDDQHSLEGRYVLVAVFFLLQLHSVGEQIFEDGLCHLDVRVRPAQNQQ